MALPFTSRGICAPQPRHRKRRPLGEEDWTRPLEGAPKTLPSRRGAVGWYGGCSSAAAPRRPLPAPGAESDVDLGSAAFATRSAGAHLVSQGRYRTADHARTTRAPPRTTRTTAHHRAPACLAPQAGGALVARKRCSCWPRRRRRSNRHARSATTVTTRPRWRVRVMCSRRRTCRSATGSSTTPAPRASRMRAGRRF